MYRASCICLALIGLIVIVFGVGLLSTPVAYAHDCVEGVGECREAGHTMEFCTEQYHWCCEACHPGQCWEA
jgi:hypothetical protein